MTGRWLRPATHAGMLGFVALTPVLGKWGMAGVALAALGLNAFLLPRTSFGRALARPGEPRWNGLLSYPLAVAVAYALFPPGVAALAWTAMALGDAAAGALGEARAWKARIPWNRRKSIAGSLAFLGAAGAGLAVGLHLVDAPPAAAALPPLAVAGAVALLGAIVETLEIPPDDNLPVALAVGGALLLLLGSP